MAKIRFLIDPNTFWMILGTSKISNFFGPVVDPRTFYLSWIYFKKYKKNTGTSLENMDFWYLRIWKSQNFRKSCVPDFGILKFRNLKIWNFEIRRSEILKIWIFDNYNMIRLWNDEKSKTRNFLGFISPPEFLEMLG